MNEDRPVLPATELYPLNAGLLFSDV